MDFLCPYMSRRKHGVVVCEPEECKQYHLMAVRSGLAFQPCEHICSLDDCTDLASQEFLEEDVFSEMVVFQFFGDAKKTICLKIQSIAKVVDKPLCVAFHHTSQ